MKKIILTLILVISFIIYLLIIILPHNYEKEYSVDGFSIVEKYEKNNFYYAFTINKNEYNFNTILNSKYLRKRGLIKSIKVINNDNYCIDININDYEHSKLCSIDNEIIDYSVIDNLHKENKIKEYQNITIFDYDHNNYFIWNYRGFYFLNNTIEQNIKLFERDVYSPDLIIKFNDYLLIPDYDQEYKFNKYYILNMNSGEVSEWKLDININFNSYNLGIVDNYLYLIDEKEEKEYQINPLKKEIKIVKEPKVYLNGWQNMGIKKIINDKVIFIKDNLYNYYLNNGFLTLKYFNTNIPIKISLLDKPNIISVDNNKVYYIKEDNLYSYEDKKQELKLLSYFEWNFNYQNKVFILNNQK